MLSGEIALKNNHYYYYYYYYLIMITESWAKEDVNDAELSIDDSYIS